MKQEKSTASTYLQNIKADKPCPSNTFSLLQSISYLTQLGFSLVTPPVLCLLLANYLQNRFEFGAWVWIIALILGFGAAVSTFMGFVRHTNRKARKKNNSGPSAFNK